MACVFLSHNSADKPFVRRLAERPTESGAMVWLDEAQLRIGDSLVDKISLAIQDVDFVVAIISKHSIRSIWVQKELNLAMTKEIENQRVVVPPGNRLERLRGNRLGQYSIRINEQYRVCFHWENGYADQVEITDYH